MASKRDTKIVNLIKAFESATNAKVIGVEPAKTHVTIYWKEKTPYVTGGWKYGTFGFPVKSSKGEFE